MKASAAGHTSKLHSHVSANCIAVVGTTGAILAGSTLAQASCLRTHVPTVSGRLMAASASPCRPVGPRLCRNVLALIVTSRLNRWSLFRTRGVWLALPSRQHAHTSNPSVSMAIAKVDRTLLRSPAEEFADADLLPPGCVTAGEVDVRPCVVLLTHFQAHTQLMQQKFSARLIFCVFAGCHYQGKVQGTRCRRVSANSCRRFARQLQESCQFREHCQRDAWGSPILHKYSTI